MRSGETIDPAERRLTAWTLLCAVLVLLAMAGPLMMGRVYTSDDLGVFHLPLRHFYAQCLARGDAFDWCPQLFAGFYLSGEGQVGMYHPLHWLLYRFLPLGPAFDLELLLSYPLLLAGMYLFLRRNVESRAAALFGALVFTFSGFNLLHFVHPHAVAIVAHIPWLLWAIDVLWHGSNRRSGVVWAAIALLTASQILLGYPQYVWFSLLAEAAYTAHLWPPHRNRSALVRLSCAKLLGLLAGAVQWLPTWDLLGNSQRQQVDAAFSQYGSLHPLNVVQLIAPYLFESRVAGGNTHELGLYVGAVPLMLVVWLLCNRREAAFQDRFLKFALALAAVAFVLALGAQGGLYLLQTWLPLVGKFRLPARYLMLVHFGLSMAAAVGWGQLLRETGLDRSSRTHWKLAAAAVGILLLAPLLWREHVASLPLMLVGPLLMSAAAGLVALRLAQVRFAAYALIALTALDLGCYGLSYAVYPNTLRLEDYLAAGDVPALTTGYRVATESGPTTLRTGNHLLVRGVLQVDGYAGLEPRKQLDYRQDATLRLAGVQWKLDPATGRWSEVSDPLPRVRLDGDGNARLIDDRPGNLRIEVDCSASQLLIVAESFHHGWRVTIDGQPAEVLRVCDDFLGCEVGPGRHEVHLMFQPASLAWGRGLSILGLVGIGIGALVIVQPRRRTTQTFQDIYQELAST